MQRGIDVKKSPPAKNFAEYMKTVPPGSRGVLRKLRATIRAAAPGAEEGISYRIPVFKLNGPLVFFAAYDDHCSMFVPGKALVASLKGELKGFHAKGATIHFTPDHPLPAAVVRKIARARVVANLDRVSVRQKR
jgi:uncharacterized protein YdhG (YjbR/CyaY superfamily)